ncbi:MAG: hypothetical protein ABSE27_01205 [Acidobacteriaceae bacterium]
MLGCRVGSTLVLAIALAGLASCGSKGSDSSGSGSTTPTAPTVTVTISPATITLGQSTVLTIVSTNATTCTESGNLVTAGAFQCNISYGATIIPTATGTFTETATVTGAGGSATASASVVVNAVPTTITSVAVSAVPASITTAQTATCTAMVQGTGAFSTGVMWSATGGTITSGGVLTPSGVGTATCTATSTQDSTKSGSATITVTAPPPPVVTSVSLTCTLSSITDIQTTSCTPTVAGTGAFTNTANLSVTPTTAGTLSATTGVSSGTAVTFTPAFTGAAVPYITATSTADSTKFATTTVTVTLRAIQLTGTFGNIWIPQCIKIFTLTVGQSGIVSGDKLYITPYGTGPSTFSSTPGSTFPVALGLGNSNGGTAGTMCSPGAYNMYVTGSDGATSNSLYISIISPWDMWAGYDSTDEYQTDFAGQTTCKYKLSDGTPELNGNGTPVCLSSSGLVNIVDGTNLVRSNLGNTSISASNTTTGTGTWANTRNGDNITDVAAKNGIIGYTTNQEVSFVTEALGSSSSPIVTDVASVGIAPASIAASTGCSPDPNTASFFSLDDMGIGVYRVDALKNASAGTVSATRIGNVSLSAFATPSQVSSTLARFVVAWDNTCKIAVMAPVLSGGNSYNMEVALVDMTTGNMHQIGTYVSDAKIPAGAIRFAADPSGNDVVIASTNEAAGTTILTRVSWTLDASENPTFTVTTDASAPPIGVYGVSLGILPNGKISAGQQQQHSVLANQ